MLHANWKECFGRSILDSQFPIVSLRGISKSFAHVVALRSIDLDIHAGEIHAVMGENGAGKSTLVKVLSGVHRRTSGQMTVRGREVDFATPKEAERNGIAIIHQELNLIPSLSVSENIFLGREPLKAGGSSTMQRSKRGVPTFSRSSELISIRAQMLRIFVWASSSWSKLRALFP